MSQLAMKEQGGTHIHYIKWKIIQPEDAVWFQIYNMLENM